MRNLTLSGYSVHGDEITVSAPTISGCIVAFRKAEAAARALRVTNPGTFAEPGKVGPNPFLAAPVDLEEPAREPLTVPPMTPAMRRPSPEPSYVDEFVS